MTFNMERILIEKFIQFMLVIFALSGCSSMKTSVEEESERTPETEKIRIEKIIAKEEQNTGIPHGILNSIAEIESKHKAYAVNARGRAHNFKTKGEAVNFVNNSLNSGCKNISIGCLQLHYKTHKKHFSSLNEMFTPEKNAAYAARLLKSLYNKYGSWEKAIKMYHTSKKKYHKRYHSKVMKAYNFMYRVS